MNPFFITRDADGLIGFLRAVFGGEEHLDARTVDLDGLLLHAELEIGGSTVMFAERKPEWPFLPQLTQVYVGDLERVLGRAKERGARIVTQPTDFFATTFSRMLDPWGNLWWVYQHGEAPELDWDSAEDGTDSDSAECPTPTSPTSTGPSSRRCRPSAPNPGRELAARGKRRRRCRGGKPEGPPNLTNCQCLGVPLDQFEHAFEISTGKG